MAETIGAMAVRLFLDDKGFQDGLKDAEGNVAGFGGRVDKLADKVGSALVGAFAAATAAVAAFGVASVRVGATFEQEITKVGAVAVDGADNMDVLTAKARELGATTQFSATQAAEAMQDFARAGMLTNEILSASGPALALAGASGADMTQATSLLAATLAQFNLESSQSARIADVFNETLKGSLFDMSSLTEAMKYAGTVGSAFGMTLEDTTASVAMFRNLGLEGSMAGTQFRMAMSAAAKVTERGEAVLNRYGLTAQDINPELHTFAEIMQTVGDAGIGATDALEVFGKKGGANVAMIASQFASGETDFHNLRDSLVNAAGSATDTYATMQDTVLGQFLIVKSTIEELMLTVFDTYAGPLKELLATLADVIQHTAATFADASSEVGQGFGDMIGDAITALRDNRELIAQTFVDFAESVVSAIQFLKAMLPILKAIGIAMVAAFAAIRVAQFVVFLQQAYAAVVALGGGVQALMAALTAATGGIYALVAAIGAALAVIAAFTIAHIDGTAEANRYADAQRRVREEIEQRKEAERAAVQAATANSNELGRSIEAQVAGTDQYTNALRRALANTRDLTDEQAAAGIAAGTHFRAFVNGKDTVLAVSDAYAIMAANVDESSVIQTQLTHEFREQERAIADAEGAVQTLVAAREEYDQRIADGQADHIVYAQTIGVVADNMEDYEVRLTAAKERVAELQTQHSKFADSVTAESHRMMVAEMEADRETADADVKAREAAQKKYRDAMKERVALAEKVRDELLNARADEAEGARLAMERQLQSARETFDAELAMLATNSSKRAALLEERERVEAEIRDTHRARERAESDAFTRNLNTALTDAILESAGDQTAIVEEAKRREIDAVRTAFADEIALYDEGTAEYAAAVERRENAVQAVEQRFAVERDARRMAAERQALDTIRQLAVADAQSRGARLIAIEQERARALEANAEASQGSIARINTHYDNQILAEKARLADEVAALQDEQIKYAEVSGVRILGVETRLFRRRRQAAEQFANDRREVNDRYDDFILSNADLTTDQLIAVEIKRAEALAAIDAEEGQQRRQRALETLGAIGDAAVNATRTVANATVSVVQSTVDALSSVFAAMTGGFAFSIADGMSSITAAADEHEQAIADLEAQLAAGEITPAQYEESLAALGEFDAGAAGEDFVSEIIGSALDFVDQLIAGAPAMIDALATQLPTLIMKVAEAIPELVQRLVAELPALLNALVEGIPVLLAGIVEAIPALVDAAVQFLSEGLPDLLAALGPIVGDLIQQLVDSIPRIVDATMASLPDVVTFLTDAIVQIVQSVPQIVETLLASIPTIITSLLAGVDRIVLALFRMIPDLVLAVVASLPDIIVALVQGLLNIVVTIAEELPVLITRIVEMLPQLIEALLSMIAPLITAIISAIPDIILGFISGLGPLITAIVGSIPQIIVAVVSALPEIIVALVEGIFFELIPMLPMIVIELIKALVVGLFDGIAQFVSFFGKVFKEAFASIGDFITDLFSGGGKDGKGKGGRLGDAWDTVKGWFGAYSGIDYVPSNRLVTVHRGEAVLTAQENKARMSGGVGGLTASQAATGAYRGNMGGGSQPVDIAIMAEGRLLDAVMVTAMQRGHAPKVEHKLRRASGVAVGFNRGRFNRYGRD